MSSPPLIPTVDRISALPDPLICHILSFLPTKLAVTTSVLSKRWILLWRSVLTLDFDDESFADFAMFRYSVYSVIVSRDITLPIRSFRIKCRTYAENFDPFDVNRFVHAAAQRQIENFDLELVQPPRCYQIPKRKELTTGIFRVLSCITLTALKLNNLTVYDVPQLVHLPLLKTLNLEIIKFIGGVSHFNNLVRGCPILEDFRTNNVDVWYHDGCDNEMDRQFEGFPYLLRADLSIFCYIPPLFWFRNTKFLYAVMLNLYEFVERVPTFPNLTHMELLFHVGCDAWKYKWVIKVLQHCPQLQNLTIVEADEEDPDYFLDSFLNEELEDLEPLPECLFSQLTTCCLRNLIGHSRDLQFAEYIMMNSKLLSTMTITSSSWVHGNRKQQMLGILSSYPRGSPTCKLLFD